MHKYHAMHNLSKNTMNWYECSWAQTPNPDCRLNELVIDCSNVNVSFRPTAMQAAVTAVKRIVATYPGPYTLMVSGGVDSQVMIHAWRTAGVPFSIVHYSYHGENKHDTETLIQFCECQNIAFTIKEFDARAFILSDEMVQMAIKYDTTSPQILTYIKFVSQHPETVVMSGNFIQQMSCGLNYTILGLQRFADMDKPNFIPFFLLSTPDLAYAFYRDYEARKLALFEFNGAANDYACKTFAYSKAGFPIVSQAGKMTGFERIKESFDNHQVPVATKLKYQAMPSKRPFDLLYRYSLYSQVGKYSEVTTVKHPTSVNRGT